MNIVDAIKSGRPFYRRSWNLRPMTGTMSLPLTFSSRGGVTGRSKHPAALGSQGQSE